MESELLSSLLAEEERLVFPSFDYQVGWDLGSALRAAALRENHRFVVEQLALFLGC